MNYNTGCIYFVECSSAMFKQILVLCLMLLSLVSCTAFGDTVSNNGIDSPNIGSKEGSDMLFDQTISVTVDNTKKVASSTK